MCDSVELPGDPTVIRENGYDTDGNATTRVEIRSLVSYSRVLVDNNNRFPSNSTPGFRMTDLAPDLLSMMRFYHEHRRSNPCKFLPLITVMSGKFRF